MVPPTGPALSPAGPFRDPTCRPPRSPGSAVAPSGKRWKQHLHFFRELAAYLLDLAWGYTFADDPDDCPKGLSSLVHSEAEHLTELLLDRLGADRPVRPLEAVLELRLKQRRQLR